MPPRRRGVERIGFFRKIWSQWWVRLATGVTIAVVPIFGAPLSLFMIQWIVGVVPITQCIEFFFVSLMVIGAAIVGIQTKYRLHLKPSVHMTWAADSSERLFWTYYIATTVLAIVYYLCAFGFLYRRYRSLRSRENDHELDDLGGGRRGRTLRGGARGGHRNSSGRPPTPLLAEQARFDHTSDDVNEESERERTRSVSAGPSRRPSQRGIRHEPSIEIPQSTFHPGREEDSATSSSSPEGFEPQVHRRSTQGRR